MNKVNLIHTIHLKLNVRNEISKNTTQTISAIMIADQNILFSEVDSIIELLLIILFGFDFIFYKEKHFYFFLIFKRVKFFKDIPNLDTILEFLRENQLYFFVLKNPYALAIFVDMIPPSKTHK